MNKTFILAIAFLLSINCFGQNYWTKFQDLSSKKDTAGQIKLLKEWESKDLKDAELYVAYYNYYVQKSMEEVIGIEHEPKGEHSLQLTDSTGKVAGYMNDMVGYNDMNLNKGFEYIDKGIAMFPNRLDMRFGKIYMLGERENYKRFTEEIIKTIDYSNSNNNAWLWAESKTKTDAKRFMLETIQSYIIQLYNTNNDSLLENMKQICESGLKYYPDHVEFLSDLSIVFMIKKEYDKALVPLLKAEKIASTDFIILNNIAQAYKRKGDNEKALAYCEKVLKYGDEQAKQSARKTMDELKKK
jgi:tetratricopeptide (TPR) repeat protein